MIWRLLTFSSLLSAAISAAAVSGQVELVDSREASVRKQRDYSGVVVWLEPASGSAPSPRPATHKIEQKGKRFLPHVLVVGTGSSVDFPNLDPIFHNAFSNFSGQPFDTGLYRPSTSKRIRFARPGIVRVFCNIHSSMSAVIAVVDTPWFAVTKADGSFEIPDVPDGDYRLRVFHERATESVLDGLQQKVRVEGTAVKTPALRISESGYLEVPHKNKHGLDYPAQRAEHQVYPGARR